MAIFTGKDGSFVFDNNEQIRVRGWTVEGNLATLETTTLGNDAVQNEAGLKSFSGTCTIMYHNDSDVLKNMLDNIFTSDVPTKAIANFKWSNRRINFRAFITSATVASSVGEIQTVDLTFTSAGDIVNAAL